MSLGSRIEKHKNPSATIPFHCGHGGITMWMSESIHGDPPGSDTDIWAETYRHSGGNNAVYLDRHVKWASAPYSTDKKIFLGEAIIKWLKGEKHGYQ